MAESLAGLRRLVLHARDHLDATTIAPKWTYDSDAWKPSQVQAYAARLLAVQVLTLVADCIEPDDTPGREADSG